MDEVTDVCDALRRQANAIAVLLVHDDGRKLACCGDLAGVDAAELASIFQSRGKAPPDETAPSSEFWVKLQRPKNTFVHVSVVGEQVALVVVFDMRSSLGLVRLRVKKAADDLDRLLKGGPNGPAGGTPPASATRG